VALAVPRQERDAAPGHGADRQQVARLAEGSVDGDPLGPFKELVEPRTPDDPDDRLSSLAGHGGQATFELALDDPAAESVPDFDVPDEPLLEPPDAPEPEEPDDPPDSPDFDELEAPSPDLAASALAPTSDLSPEPSDPAELSAPLPLPFAPAPTAPLLLSVR